MYALRRWHHYYRSEIALRRIYKINTNNLPFLCAAVSFSHSFRSPDPRGTSRGPIIMPTCANK